MAQITFKNNPINTEGSLPEVGSKALGFSVVDTSLATVKLSDFAGKKVVLNSFPSVDTGVCALQLKTFSQRLAQRDDVVLLFISQDLPFALGRFCGAEGIENAVTASSFRDDSFARAYGLKMIDGPLEGLLARATLVLDESHTVVHAELVPEIAQEPDYDAAMAVV